jgi:TRAP-type C4-dicarboxylate transport system permease large subunit
MGFTAGVVIGLVIGVAVMIFAVGIVFKEKEPIIWILDKDKLSLEQRESFKLMGYDAKNNNEAVFIIDGNER